MWELRSKIECLVERPFSHAEKATHSHVAMRPEAHRAWACTWACTCGWHQHLNGSEESAVSFHNSSKVCLWVYLFMLSNDSQEALSGKLAQSGPRHQVLIPIMSNSWIRRSSWHKWHHFLCFFTQWATSLKHTHRKLWSVCWHTNLQSINAWRTHYPQSEVWIGFLWRHSTMAKLLVNVAT